MLPEEYLILMIEMNEKFYGTKTPKVIAKVLACSYTEGTQVNFINGVGKTPGGHAVALDKLNGIFVVKKDADDNWLAEAEAKTILARRIPKSQDNVLCYMTPATYESSMAANVAFKKLCKKDVEVMIVPYLFDAQKVKILSNSVVIGNEEVIKYVGGSNNKTSNFIATKAYGFLKGRIKSCIMYEKEVPVNKICVAKISRL